MVMLLKCVPQNGCTILYLETCVLLCLTTQLRTCSTGQLHIFEAIEHMYTHQCSTLIYWTNEARYCWQLCQNHETVCASKLFSMHVVRFATPAVKVCK